MGKGNLYIKIVSFFIFLAVACYLGIYIYNFVENPVQTTIVGTISVNDSIITEGYVVRREVGVQSAGGSMSYLVEDGEKVANGQVVAVSYNSGDAMEQAERIKELSAEIDQLEEALRSGGNKENGAASAAAGMAKALSVGSYDDIASAAGAVELYIFENSGKNEEEMSLRLESLKNEYSRCIRNEKLSNIYAAVSGTYSSVCDGYEHVTPEDIENITPSELESLFAYAGTAGDAGKLVTDIRWYYVTVLDELETGGLAEGGRAELIFAESYSASLKMKVESISRPENGKCAVVFSADTKLVDTINLRNTTAEIVLKNYTGIGVPKESLHLNDEGGTCVYVVSGLQMEQVDVSILMEMEDYYIVSGDSTRLHENSEIIVTGRGLYDGKVIG